MNPKTPNKLINRLTDLIFYLAIFIFIVALAFPHNPAGNWYQQFLPSIGSQQINDITFLDSLTGFAVASKNINPDTASILRTTNGGDNWQIVFTQGSRRFSRVIFINSLTGFISGGSGSGTPYLYKTTNGGNNWNTVPGATLGTAYWNDMSVISEDTIWLVDANSFNGGVFFTSNGGVNWQNQLNLGSQNPNHVYMYNARIGFICEDNFYLRRTTNGGANWTPITGENGFTDMFFADSLTGWKSNGSMKKTTNGGINWITQILPSGGLIVTPNLLAFSNINRDTIWGVGGEIINGSTTEGMLFHTTNGGDTWRFQVPDTSINYGIFSFVQFVSPRVGWAYYSNTYGIHTTNGGDTTFLLPVHQINTEVPKEYSLYQNYPNPFNAMTNVKFQISNAGTVLIKLFDITGREIAVILNEKLNTGIYEITFDANNFSSGVYFYSLFIEGKLIDTKKMILVK
jgi:photosystem II stability/assembly factor-like uncharacterized protein